MHRKLSTRLGSIMALLFQPLLLAPSSAQVVLFSDSFEVAIATCYDGPQPQSGIEGALGGAPSGNYSRLACVEFSNDSAENRLGEIGWGGVPVARAVALVDSDLPRLALVAAGGRRVALQVEPISRWAAPLADIAAPIRWLKLIAPVVVAAESVSSYELRLYHAAIPSVAALDDLANILAHDGLLHTVTNGVAELVVDQSNPAAIDAFSLTQPALLQLYDDQPGAGPFISFGGTTLDTATPGEVMLDSGGFRQIEVGPVRTSFAFNGHFVSPAALCSPGQGIADYQRFGYTMVLSISRGSSEIELDLTLRNECSDGSGSSWTDEAITVDQAGWRLPLTLASGNAWYGGDGLMADSAGNDLIVNQRKGAGPAGSWARRARVLVDGSQVESAEAFDAPALGVANSQAGALLQLAWMRYREPQALALSGSTLSMELISEPLVVGEGKGIWNLARLALSPASTDWGATFEAQRRAAVLKLERTLVPRLPTTEFNATAVVPPLGGEVASNFLTGYRNFMQVMHQGTVSGSDSQWRRFNTYGSQLWPDIQFDDWGPGLSGADSPADNSGEMNYWNPSGSEMLEFLRSGEPLWLWDFSMPQSWLQIFTARLNLGANSHSNRNGSAVTSGGTGEGQWHRSAWGSDDYTYNVGAHIAYALQPRLGVRDRFAHGGRDMVARYSVPWNSADICYLDPPDPDLCNPPDMLTQSDRDYWLSAVFPARGNMQRFELIANCAEYVPGAIGHICHDRLAEIMVEMAEDNLRAGLICQDDLPVDDDCDLPQTFMISSMQYHTFLRYLLNYGEVNNQSGQPTLQPMLTGYPSMYFSQGMSQAGGSPDPFGDWSYALWCELTAGGNTVGLCTWYDSGDGFALYYPNKPQVASLGLVAHTLDPAVDLCAEARALIDAMFADVANDSYGPMGGYARDGGWWKGAAQASQFLVYGLGAYEACD